MLRSAYLNAGINFFFTTLPFLVAMSCFYTYTLGFGEILTADKAFVSLAYLNTIRMPMGFLPIVIVYLVQCKVSLDRLNKYLNNEDVAPDAVKHDSSEKDPMVIENGSFSWGKDEPAVLQNLNIRVKKGSLTAVVGNVGSGKSSLVSAFLGELERLEGRVNTVGSIAYVPQQAWMQNCTLRDNVLFGEEYDERKYDAIINACALRSDIDILPGGDQTEIGEKGINVSGGQKQRVSLARACYSDADIFILDDPLSAVDSHVGKHIFERVVGPRGLLRRKTRVLGRHSVLSGDSR